MANRLELTWIGKEDRQEVEPRILIEDPIKSCVYGDKKSSGQMTIYELMDEVGLYDNMLIHGDNLLALKALEQKYAGKVKCIYIDPPYNINAANEYYDDYVEHSKWLSLMRPRLEILKNLLSEEGVIFIQINDDEQAYLKVLCDEIFGRTNFVNTISILFKNVAGASGGGEDKKFKKNIEYIHVYSRNYDCLKPFNAVYKYTEIYELVKKLKENKVSWKYGSVLYDKGEKEYIATTVDGDGNDIKIYKRNNVVIKSIGQIAKEEKITEKEVYYKYIDKIFRTTMPQSSIRPRVMEKMKELNEFYDIISIEYTPKTGRNKGIVYEQFYKGDKYNLFAWLLDVVEIKEGIIYKKDKQGTFWDFVSETKNLTKEGNVLFPNSKKPEALIKQIITATTNPGDLVLDSFLGSGTTAAVAHKMGRRWIGIEMGDHAYTHCKVRLDKVVRGEDQGGITKSVDWKGGGGYKFYELAPTLVKKDKHGREIINPEYNADMLAAAMALHEGFKYEPSNDKYWKQGKSTENSYIYTTTRHLTRDYLEEIASEMTENEYLLIACKSYENGLDREYSNIAIKKIPQMLLGRCEFDKNDYSLNIIDMPEIEEVEE